MLLAVLLPLASIASLGSAQIFPLRPTLDCSGLRNHTVPPLPYAYDALEPYISAQIMQLHHDRHHLAYVTGLNTAEREMCNAISVGNVTAEVQLTSPLRFNGGGHINHSLFWRILTPNNSTNHTIPRGSDLEQAIVEQFGSLSSFITLFNSITVGIQGSGWGWLTYNRYAKALDIITTANQDIPPSPPHVPIIGIDVWEHAYYLEYLNNRGAYLAAIWNVINWVEAEWRYDQAVSGTSWGNWDEWP